MLGFIRRHKIAIGLISLNIIVVIAIIIVIIIHHAKTAVIDIRVTPTDATISLNGNKYNNLESHEVLPGNYHVMITMDNMRTKEYDISLEDDGYVRIWDYLLDVDDSFDHYLTHPTDANILIEIASESDKNAQAFISDYKKKISILGILPIDFDEYTNDYADYIQYHININPTQDCPKIACLIIEDNTGGNKQIAENKLRELGYNPNDYDIFYDYVPLYTSEMNNRE